MRLAAALVLAGLACGSRSAKRTHRVAGSFLIAAGNGIATIRKSE